ncbi:MAG: (2Fe-2S)-binding protein [Candidatus Acidiferrales bacterium]
MARITKIRVNGTIHKIDADEGLNLLDVLREQLDFTGTKYGCGEGQCGACTVLVNGQAQRSCVTPVGEVAGAEITTIEGLAREGRLHPVQQAFLDENAMQCAYCTSGMILSAVAMLRANANPSVPQIIEGMEGNICRCGTYPRIVAAVQRAAKTMKGRAR